jgi:hypothetical protein
MLSEMFISKHVTFLEKKIVLERSSRRKIKLKEDKEPQTDIQLKPRHEAIKLDV